MKIKYHRNLFCSILLILCFLSCQTEINPAYVYWPMYSGDNSGSRYSTLTQINKRNVSQLKPIWVYHTDDAKRASTIQCNPIVIKDRMFVISPALKVAALDAKTGKEIWTFDPFDGNTGAGNSRGVSYWTDGKEERIFYAGGSFLYALNAKDGKAISSFGESGKIDLHIGLGSMALLNWVGATTPGIIYKDLLIMGSRVGEGPSQAAPGHIRAFNVRSGNLEWMFKTIPEVGTFGADTWTTETLEEMGGANSWGGFTLDAERGMVFCGTGSAAYDHWGGNRIGANLFANCVLALDAASGKRIWHYQVVHHDIWDYDVPCPPNLVQVKKNGQLIDAVAQPTKMGHLFILDRETGKPLFPVEEKPVPQSNIPGEQTWPTQAFPSEDLRYGQQQFLESDITNISAEANHSVKTAIKDFVLGGVFLPPVEKPSVTIPQFNGGTDWGGAAYDPEKRMLYVNCSNEAEWISMKPTQPKNEISQYNFGVDLYQTLCSSCHGVSNDKNTGAPSLKNLQDIAKEKKEQGIIDILKNGKGAMPSFPQLSDDEIQAIVAMLNEEGKKQMLKSKELQLSFSNNIPWTDTGHNELKDHEGFPANKPPWGTLSAISMDEGKIKWQVPLGTYPELEKRGFPPTGTFNMGGPLVTASGLVFIASTMDERIRAFDADTGEVLWEFQMEAGGYATPSVFELNGKQHLVIGAGGGGKPGTKSGDAYYCFAL